MTDSSHVIIVGGGPVGLSAAILCARAGMSCTVLERTEEPNGHPKARGIRTRTMELFTQWGLADELWAKALPAEANRFIYCDSLAGDEIARSPQVEAGNRASAAADCRVAQNAVHSVLVRLVDGLDNVDYRAGAAAVGVEQDDNHVNVLLENGSSIAADFVIAADGVRSTVRGLLDIAMSGDEVLGYGQSIYWRGDLSQWVQDRPCIQFVTGDRAGRSSNIASVDGRYHWVTMVMQPTDGDRRPVPPTVDQARAIIAGAVGEDVGPDILDIATWRISAQVADKWRHGRIFLAGDAAHSFPPTGGFGMNTGIQDVHNLVWKLACVANRAASDQLLDSYELERKPVAESNARWSKQNGARFRAISRAIAAGDDDALARAIEDQRHHVDATMQDLAFGYLEGAFVPALEPVEQAAALTTALPGHRFPECPVDFGGVKQSSVRTFAENFFIVAHDPAGWRAAAVPVAARRNIRIDTVTIVEPNQTSDPLAGAEAALVRPDGIVGWICTKTPADPAADLDAALTTILA